MRKLSAILLTVLLLVSSMAVSAFAAEGTCGPSVNWVLEDGVLTLSGTGGTVKYERNGNTDAVNNPWWGQRDTITKIVVEDGITVLDNYAFYACKNLVEVQLPDSLEKIESRVFAGCSKLTSITFPRKLAYLGYEAFVDSGLTEIVFEGYAPKASATPPFTGLTATVSFNGDPTFSAVDYGGMLTWVTTAPPDNSPDPAEGLDMSNPEKEGTCGSGAVWAFKNGTLLIHGAGETDKYTRNPDLDTVNSPWYDIRDKIETVVVAKGITRVNNYAFYHCENLTSVALPSTVVAINYGAFKGCTALKELTLSKNVIEIGSQAFADSGLETLTFEGAIPTDIGDLMTDGVTATVYYPCTEEDVSLVNVKVFGGTLNWTKSHDFDGEKCKICGAEASEVTPGEVPGGTEPGASPAGNKTPGITMNTLSIISLCLAAVSVLAIALAFVTVIKMTKKDR